MCAISGMSPPEQKLIKSITRSMQHRGPDAEGYYSDEHISLGHRRLSIIDLSDNGKQPMMDKDEEIVITFNGEIYNYKELKKQLEGFEFKSSSDTEAIVYGYKKWGIKVLEKLNGMFAFCIYDKKKKKLFLARDRMGIKPLYYYTNKKQKQFYFASEIKALIKTQIPRKINTAALNNYISYGYTRDETLVENCKKLLPGEYLIYDLAKKEISEKKKYWQIDFSKKKDYKTDELITNIRKHLDQSVKKRLVADVPVGAFLSGGIDSSAIVAYAHKYKPDLKTFSVGFDYAEFDESIYARKVAKKIGTDHHEVSFSSEEVCKFFDNITTIIDEPFADPSLIPTHMISKYARKQVTVCLSGDGGDESFGGYERYSWYNKIKWHAKTPKLMTKTFIRPAVNLSYAITKKHLFNKGRIFVEDDNISKSELYNKTMVYTSEGIKKKLLKKEYLNVINDKAFNQYNNNDDLFAADFKNYLPNDILTKVDVASMQASLESRVPFLDHEFVEFSATIKPEEKIRKGVKKAILKKSLRGIIPDEIIDRKKRGFSVPLKHYFRSNSITHVDELIKNKDSELYTLLDQKALAKIWQKHRKGIQDNNYIIYATFVLGKWLDQLANE